ncbi:MAG: PepSY-associated TM helix domain-containing protein [Burkholderiaceae bacterium]
MQTGHPALRSRRGSRRATVVQWLRKTHGWIGLWGATLGLLFGVSGIWLNHRTLLKLPPVAQQRSEVQLALPDPPPADAQALAAWLQQSLQIDAAPISVKVEPARPVAWAAGDAAGGGAAPLRQPAHWTIQFGGPQALIQAEAWAGNRSVSVRHIENGLLATLMNLHKGTAMPVGWILLVDTLAGSLILLSISGLALWMLTHRRRTAGLLIFGSALALGAGLATSRML